MNCLTFDSVGFANQTPWKFGLIMNFVNFFDIDSWEKFAKIVIYNWV